jgi:uncharacterized protein (TIRG00374 family)
VAATESEFEEQAEWSEPLEQQTEQELAIGRRLTNWKSLASFAIAIVVLAFALKQAKVNPSEVWARAQTLNVALYLLAFVVYYTTFPIRGFRWKVLLENAYDRTHPEVVDQMHVRGLTEILYISWFVNCVVPAKLGDLYRAYLAKLWVHVSWAKTIGTIVAERIIDVLVLSALLAGSGFVMFHNRLGHVSTILLLGFGLSILGVLALVAMKAFSERIRALLGRYSRTARLVEKYVSFEEGTLHSFQRPVLLLGLTVVIWLLEGARIQLVFAALGLQAHMFSVPFVPMLFFALATAVLTTVPFTPGGLGLVEAGLIGIMIYFGIPTQDATVVVLFDRVLSYLSVAVLGFLVYLVSKRSHFRHPL